MRVWFLKETKSVCTSCATGCNILIGSREERLHRYTPRSNEAVNGEWMCDQGRLNYRWIGREDRLRHVERPRAEAGSRKTVWASVQNQVVQHLRGVAPGSVALIASARHTTEELWLLKKIASRVQALTDSVPRSGEPDRLLVNADRNPNSQGARLTGICGSPMGRELPRIVEAIRTGTVRTLVVFGEDVTRHGLDSGLLDRLELLIVSDILPNPTTLRAHVLLPGCAHAEKRGTFINSRGHVQRFQKAIEPPGDARPEWEFLAEWVAQLTGEPPPASIEGLFNRMVSELPALNGLTWAGLGDAGMKIDF
jgi:NADH-quinone oxidoreductase subunit G